MAAATDSTPAPARRLLRAAGPGRVLTTAEVIGLVDAASVFSDLVVGCAHPAICALPAAGRHARVLRQNDAGVLLRVPRGAFASVRPLYNRRSSSPVLPAPVRLRS